MANGDDEVEEAELSPAARIFHAPRFNCHILSIIGCSSAVDPAVIKLGLQQTLIKHPRFSSKLNIKGRKMKWIPTTVNLQDHIINPKVDPNMESPDRFVEDYISHLTTMTMEITKPLWELHILNIKTSNAQSICVLKIHHSIGDGASLMSLLLACTRKTSDPESLPTIPVQKRAGSNTTSGVWWFFLATWMVLRMIWNTLVDLILFSATVLFLKDTKTPFKGTSRVDLKPKRLVYRTVSLDDIKLVKTKMNTTINDVILGVTQAGLSRYLNQECGENDKKGGEAKQNKIRLRATVLMNLRPTPGIQSLAELMSKESKQTKWGWGNRIGYIVLPFKIGIQKEALEYVRQAKATIDRKKLSLEAPCTFRIAKLAVDIFGVKALTIHYQSYFNKMTIVVAVDPDVIPNPHKLCDHLEESLNIIKNAALDKGPDAA
ncbi:wax ester synthase/diacylglycerol acyltransferase 11-like isoform X2 [Mercurialis annua]|uniref:wax ester synthase/diacylglycerol acyltransferase 11-like isoform X2 n=1 Tax=Mercurialis annua TaxID=3986 RepID=UPI00215F6285|nr:wax ester synthase/diacylglycerol acyltransferase 11-like isoform X2 [Mercurialis annua]